MIAKTRSQKLTRNRTDETIHFGSEGTLRGTTEAKRSSGRAGKDREKRAGLGKKKRAVVCGEKTDFKKGDQLSVNRGMHQTMIALQGREAPTAIGIG